MSAPRALALGRLVGDVPGWKRAESAVACLDERVRGEGAHRQTIQCSSVDDQAFSALGLILIIGVEDEHGVPQSDEPVVFEVAESRHLRFR